MEGPKGKFWTKIIYKTGTRMFYLLLGLGLIIFGKLNYGT